MSKLHYIKRISKICQDITKIRSKIRHDVKKCGRQKVRHDDKNYIKTSMTSKIRHNVKMFVMKSKLHHVVQNTS